MLKTRELTRPKPVRTAQASIPTEAELQSMLGYVFHRAELLQEALTHRSHWQGKHWDRLPDNERLEFLGDAVLSLVVSEYLLGTYPALREGELSKIKAHVVSRASLAGVARRLGLGRFLRLGRGEEVNCGREKDSLLANALEAVIAAIYLDGGLASARECILRLFRKELIRSDHGQEGLRDYKSRLQEWSQKHCGDVPQYRTIHESGPDHRKAFQVEVIVTNELRGVGIGRTKKEAEQMAAKHVLRHVLHDSIS
ncbi:MAG: ribonuclease III [Nitrospirae bacterium]|nr:MAG: ribonuclease III [Nitrospirota bacterium]